MYRIKQKPEAYKFYLDDCSRIQKALKEEGCEAGLKECYDLWMAYSDTYCASWLSLPETESEIISILRPYLEEIT